MHLSVFILLRVFIYLLLNIYMYVAMGIPLPLMEPAIALTSGITGAYWAAHSCGCQLLKHEVNFPVDAPHCDAFGLMTTQGAP